MTNNLSYAGFLLIAFKPLGQGHSKERQKRQVWMSRESGLGPTGGGWQPVLNSSNLSCIFAEIEISWLGPTDGWEEDDNQLFHCGSVVVLDILRSRSGGVCQPGCGT